MIALLAIFYGCFPYDHPIEVASPRPDSNSLTRGYLAAPADCDAPTATRPIACLAATDWPSGTSAPLPREAVLPGVMFGRGEGGGFAVLAVDTRGETVFASMVYLRPEDFDELAQLDDARDAVERVLRGEESTVELSAPLDAYLTPLAERATRPLTRFDQGWVGERIELRRIGRAWVAIEQDKKPWEPNWVGIFPDTGRAR